MIALEHFYSKYGLAVALHRTEKEFNEIDAKDLSETLAQDIGKFRLKPAEDPEDGKPLRYDFANLQKGGGKKTGVFLAPAVIATDKLAGGLWKNINKLIEDSSKEKFDPYKVGDLSQSLAPSAGEFANRKKPKVTAFEQLCSALTTITPIKPAITKVTKVGGKVSMSNISILPDLPIDDMVVFVDVFNEMHKNCRDKKLFDGKYEKKEFKRPKITRGNFPYAPYSASIGVVGLLGAIGRWAEEADQWKKASKALESLKNKPIYIVSYGNVQITSVNNYIVDLAKENKLSEIVNSLYRVDILSSKVSRPNPQHDSTKYETFDLFAGRFLQLFNHPAFVDFISIRAEYPETLIPLFVTYFNKMEKIDMKIIESCRALGKWFNQVAYFTAKKEVENIKDFENMRKAKSKILVELESAAFAAKTGYELIAHTVTRAGRLSGMDAPAEAELFMTVVSSGELKVDVAKNLIMAFARLKYASQTAKGVSDDSQEDKDLMDE